MEDRGGLGRGIDGRETGGGKGGDHGRKTGREKQKENLKMEKE